MFGVLARMFPTRIGELEAKLEGVAGFTGRGEIEVSFWSQGYATVETELRGVAGLRAEVYVNDVCVGTVDIKDGRSDTEFDTRRTGITLIAEAGDRVEIRQNGDAILRGVLYPD